MAGVVNNISAFTDYGAEQKDIERRLKMADMLRQQSMVPLEQQAVGGQAIPLSWTQGLAKVLQGGAAGYQERKLKDEQTALASKRNQALAAALAGMPMAQTTELPGSQADQGQFGMAPQTQTQQPTMQQNAQWLGQLAQVGPDAMQIGGTLLGMQQKHDENADTRAFRAQQAAEARQARIQELNMKLLDARLNAQDRADLQRELAENKNELARELAQGRNENALAIKELGRGMAANQPVTAVTLQDPNNPNGTIVIDGRSGKVFGKGPKLTDSGKLENKRQFNMQGIGQVIQTAEDLLGGAGGRPLPTGSGIGTAVDAAAGLFGISPSGAKEADQIASVGAALVSKMPRMEGPQSDKDVALYKEAAGKIGDSKVPVERRKAALETVKGLWSKYENLNPSAFQGGSPVASGGWTVVK